MSLDRKFPGIPGFDLVDLYLALNTAPPGTDGSITTADVGRVTGCDARSADAALRAAARMGYLEPDGGVPFRWRPTLQADSLASTRPMDRVPRHVIDDVIARVLAEAFRINREARYLVEIETIVLFGSALDRDREDYGDIDLDIRFAERDPAAPVAACRLDKVEIEARLTGISRIVSLHEDQETLSRFRRRVIFRWDAASGAPVPASCLGGDIPEAAVLAPPKALPRVTAMASEGAFVSEGEAAQGKLIDVLPGMLRAEDAFEIEARAWTPEIRSGVARSRVIPTGSVDAVAGYHHLCPHWKEDITGLEKLRRTLAWCRNGDMLRGPGIVARIWQDGHRRVASIDGPDVKCLVTCDYTPNVVQGLCAPVDTTRLSLCRLAGGFALVHALHACMEEMKASREYTAQAGYPIETILYTDTEDGDETMNDADLIAALRQLAGRLGKTDPEGATTSAAAADRIADLASVLPVPE